MGNVLADEFKKLHSKMNDYVYSKGLMNKLSLSEERKLLLSMVKRVQYLVSSGLWVPVAVYHVKFSISHPFHTSYYVFWGNKHLLKLYSVKN